MNPLSPPRKFLKQVRNSFIERNVLKKVYFFTGFWVCLFSWILWFDVLVLIFKILCVRFDLFKSIHFRCFILEKLVIFNLMDGVLTKNLLPLRKFIPRLMTVDRVNKWVKIFRVGWHPRATTQIKWKRVKTMLMQKIHN